MDKHSDKILPPVSVKETEDKLVSIVEDTTVETTKDEIKIRPSVP